MKAILIYSGGLDSTTLLYEYKDEISLAVTFDYGAKHGAREIECAKYNCNKLGIKHLIIPLDFMGKYFRSNLLESGGEMAWPRAMTLILCCLQIIVGIIQSILTAGLLSLTPSILRQRKELTTG